MRINILIMAPFILSSCLATPPISPAEALLTQSSADSRRILEKAIGDLLNSQPIKLADNIFAKKSTAIIERSRSKDKQGHLINGREFSRVDTFSLLTANGNCYVRHDQNGDIKLLVNISCHPSKPNK